MIDQSLLNALDGIVFLTACNGTIQAIGTPNWDRFANANGAHELSAESVLGRCLFDFIAGDDVREQLQRTMGRMAADPGASLVVPFRCDSPDIHRTLRQSLRPVFSADTCTGFVFQSIEVEMQLRPSIGLFDFKELERRHAHDASLPLVVMCSWCQKIRDSSNGDARWIEAEEYYSSGGESRIRLSHSICEQCTQRVSDY